MQDVFASTKLLSRIPRDIAWLLKDSEVERRDNAQTAGDLWDNRKSSVGGGVNYGFEVSEE